MPPVRCDGGGDEQGVVSEGRIEEEFFRWDALVEMQRHVAQRLVLLLADSSA
jgi:hypothetical protein